MTRTKSTEVDQEAVLTRSQPSVTIKLDGKGVFSYEVKAYADTMEEALAQAVMAVNNLENQKLGKMPE
jgi:hypothetical protein